MKRFSLLEVCLRNCLLNGSPHLGGGKGISGTFFVPVCGVFQIP